VKFRAFLYQPRSSPPEKKITVRAGGISSGDSPLRVIEDEKPK
jgi:hypothetical protein